MWVDIEMAKSAGLKLTSILYPVINTAHKTAIVINLIYRFSGQIVADLGFHLSLKQENTHTQTFRWPLDLLYIINDL